MSDITTPVFVIGSGRCGTRSIYKMLSGAPGLEVHHEFVCTQVQKLACLYFMGKIDKESVKDELRSLHGAGIAYSDAKIWLDSSNKLSWLIEPLAEMYPNARFLAMVRDGRKVTSSFFYKLAAEMYDDHSTQILSDWLAAPDRLLPPPPEKKYWWNIPQTGQAFHEEFAGFDQFERICYHWSEVNRVILRDLAACVTPQQQMLVKLEDMTSNPDVLRDVIDFIGAPFDREYVEFLKTPQNVFFPMDFKLTEEQLTRFWNISRPMMQRLGYEDSDVYTVQY